VINKKTKADAYRASYNTTMKPKALGSEACKLSKDPRISLEIEKTQRALEALEYRSPSHLRALVVQSLTEVLLDEEAKHSDKINASKVIGEITGVDLFKPVTTESKAVTSKVAKDQILNEIKRLIKGQTSDDVVDIEAHTLLEELAAEAHPGAAPPSVQSESLPDVHTIPLKQSPQSSISDFPNEINDLRYESDSDVPHPSDFDGGQAVDKNMETPPGDESDGFHR
jgi:hypothetical protein